MDHLGGIAWHCATRALRGMPPPTYVVPRAVVDEVRELFRVWRTLDRSDLEHELVGAEPGDEVPVGKNLVARPFRTFHPVACQGYAIWSRKKKLKPEYAGLSTKEIQDLVVRQQVEVSEPIETPELAFTGDTLIDALEREEVMRRARVLVMEVTFLDDRVSVSESRAMGHVHLDEVIARADLFENEALVLTHFSSRYDRTEIRALLDERLPPTLRDRAMPLLTGHRS